MADDDDEDDPVEEEVEGGEEKVTGKFVASSKKRGKDSASTFPTFIPDNTNKDQKNPSTDVTTASKNAVNIFEAPKALAMPAQTGN